MSRTSKARREAYDNIATGGGTAIITSRERTVPDLSAVKAGALPPDFTTFGNTENISVGVDYGADENIVVSGTNMLAGERLG
jgi:hypothetical protein